MQLPRHPNTAQQIRAWLGVGLSVALPSLCLPGNLLQFGGHSFCLVADCTSIKSCTAGVCVQKVNASVLRSI